MKIVKIETVTRYQIQFEPKETAQLLKLTRFAKLISTKAALHNGHTSSPYGCAHLTRTQINDACDALGGNGREFMATVKEIK